MNKSSEVWNHKLCTGKFRMAEGRVQEEAGGGQQVNSSKAWKTRLGNLDLPPQVKLGAMEYEQKRQGISI